MLTNIRSRSLALAAVSVAVGLASHPALAATGTGTATATILGAITVTPKNTLAFGNILAPAGGGTVTLSSAGALSSSPATFSFFGGSGVGTFDVAGTAGAPVSVSFSTGDSLTGPGANMALGTYDTGATVPASFPGSGTFTMSVGATLTVGVNQVAGPYSGTYTVTVNY